MHVELKIQIVKSNSKMKCKSSLCDCSDAHIILNGTKVITKVGADSAARPADKRNKHSLTA